MIFKRYLLFSLFFLRLPLLCEKLNIITVLYNETKPQRMQEYITCMKSNLAHPSIDNIHVVYDTVRDDNKNELHEFLRKQKITLSYVQGRPSFLHCFKLANQMFPNAKVIIMNADIHFNETLTILENYDLTKKFLAITRKEVAADGSLSYLRGNAYRGRQEGSQDVWIFQTPIALFKREDIKLGTMHCEGEVAFEMAKLGYEIINPYFTIDCLHVHLSGVRHWIDRNIPWGTYLLTVMTDLPEKK